MVLKDPYLIAEDWGTQRAPQSSARRCKKMQALAEICRSYPDFKQKKTYMEILLKHFGDGGKAMNKE